MKHFSLLSFALSFMVVFASCNEHLFWPDDEEGFLNQELVIKNADGTSMKTKNKLAIGNKNSYPIGSAFWGGQGDAYDRGHSHWCHLLSESLTEYLGEQIVESLIIIDGFRYKGTEYTSTEQCINRMLIRLDKLGYGDVLEIPMNQGKYEGGSDLVKEVKINSYKFSTYKEDNRTPNEDGKIDIRILMKDGTKIAILFAGYIPHDYVV